MRQRKGDAALRPLLPPYPGGGNGGVLREVRPTRQRCTNHPQTIEPLPGKPLSAQADQLETDLPFSCRRFVAVQISLGLERYCESASVYRTEADYLVWKLFGLNSL